jgi:hypothetical protein
MRSNHVPIPGCFDRSAWLPGALKGPGRPPVGTGLPEVGIAAAEGPGLDGAGPDHDSVDADRHAPQGVPRIHPPERVEGSPGVTAGHTLPRTSQLGGIGILPSIVGQKAAAGGRRIPSPGPRRCHVGIAARAHSLMPRPRSAEHGAGGTWGWPRGHARGDRSPRCGPGSGRRCGPRGRSWTGGAR